MVAASTLSAILLSLIVFLFILYHLLKILLHTPTLALDPQDSMWHKSKFMFNLVDSIWYCPCDQQNPGQSLRLLTTNYFEEGMLLRHLGILMWYSLHVGFYHGRTLYLSATNREVLQRISIHMLFPRLCHA